MIKLFKYFIFFFIVESHLNEYLSIFFMSCFFFKDLFLEFVRNIISIWKKAPNLFVKRKKKKNLSNLIL